MITLEQHAILLKSAVTEVLAAHPRGGRLTRLEVRRLADLLATEHGAEETADVTMRTACVALVTATATLQSAVAKSDASAVVAACEQVHARLLAVEAAEALTNATRPSIWCGTMLSDSRPGVPGSVLRVASCLLALSELRRHLLQAASWQGKEVYAVAERLGPGHSQVQIGQSVWFHAGSPDADGTRNVGTIAMPTECHFIAGYAIG